MEILQRPIVTEKINAKSEKLGQYGFIVSNCANKLEIKSAVETMYNVTVESVNTINCGGKNKSRYTKAGFVQGKRSDFKKAIVTLKKGDVIDFYSNI